MNQHQAGTAANPPGTGLEYRNPALSRPLAERAGWTDADVRAVDTARLLAADVVQQAGSGHPGTCQSVMWSRSERSPGLNRLAPEPESSHSEL
jgi:hypothetical protein